MKKKKRKKKKKTGASLRESLNTENIILPKQTILCPSVETKLFLQLLKTSWILSESAT